MYKIIKHNIRHVSLRVYLVATLMGVMICLVAMYNIMTKMVIGLKMKKLRLRVRLMLELI